MNDCLITFRSVTPAQRAEGILKKQGISCTLRRTPRWMEEKGCGYCLQLPQERLADAVAQLRSANVNFRKVYSISGMGDAREVSL